MGSPGLYSTPAEPARRGLGTRQTAQCSNSFQSFRSTAQTGKTGTSEPYIATTG